MSETLFSPEKIDEMPTIMDVVERISAIENKMALPFIDKIPLPEELDEGRYCFVSEQNNRAIAHLMPMSQSPFTFYRGQSKYYDSCLTSLYRKKDGNELLEEDIAYRRIKICEFILTLGQHPVYGEVCQGVSWHPVALAQHYGLATEYLDITNSKWVAAFFAATSYDEETDTYYPVGRDYGNGYGVMYISKDIMREGAIDDFFVKNGVIGYQYFDRPTKQSSFGFRMDKGENFNKSPFFDKVFFRHDIEDSQMVFDMSYQQRRFIPNDTLSKVARQIATSNNVTPKALMFCRQTYYPDKSPDFLERVCSLKGLKVLKDREYVVEYPQREIEEEWRVWNEFGRADLRSRILPIRPVSLFTFSE